MLGLGRHFGVVEHRFDTKLPCCDQLQIGKQHATLQTGRHGIQHASSHTPYTADKSPARAVRFNTRRVRGRACARADTDHRIDGLRCRAVPCLSTMRCAHTSNSKRGGRKSGMGEQGAERASGNGAEPSGMRGRGDGVERGGVEGLVHSETPARQRRNAPLRRRLPPATAKGLPCGSNSTEHIDRPLACPQSVQEYRVRRKAQRSRLCIDACQMQPSDNASFSSVVSSGIRRIASMSASLSTCGCILQPLPLAT